MEIEKKKINFINRQKLLAKIKNFWESMPGETMEEKSQNIIMNVDSIEKFDQISKELADSAAESVTCNGVRMKPSEALESFEGYTQYMELFKVCFESIKPSAEKN